jgi:rhodanese-related sulfurtransferase
MTQHIGINDLHQQLTTIQTKDGVDLILDVRSPEEYASGHVPGSQNIPHTEVIASQNELKKYQRIFIYCQAGRRSQVAAAALESQGFQNLICVSGTGMAQWIAAGYPTEE